MPTFYEIMNEVGEPEETTIHRGDIYHFSCGSRSDMEFGRVLEVDGEGFYYKTEKGPLQTRCDFTNTFDGTFLRPSLDGKGFTVICKRNELARFLDLPSSE